MFELPEARRLAERLEIHYTPMHDSYLNNGNVLDRLILNLETVKAISLPWENNRKNSLSTINWHFKVSIYA